MKNKILQTIIFIIIRDSLILFKIFLSPQVRPCAIITHKHSLNESSHYLSNDLRPGILENQEILEKCLSFIESQLSTHGPGQKKMLLIEGKKSRKIATKVFLLRAISHEITFSFTYFKTNGLWKYFSHSNLSHTP